MNDIILFVLSNFAIELMKEYREVLNHKSIFFVILIILKVLLKNKNKY